MSDAESTPEKANEVVEETRESLEILRLDRTPRPEKMARELALVKDAHEVHFTLRRTHMRDDIDAVRAGVDALKIERRALPEARAPPPVPQAAPEAESGAPLVDLTPEEQDAIARRLPGRLIRVDTLYRTGAGHAVEVVVERDDGARVTESLILRNGVAASVDEVARAIDDVALPDSAYESAPAEVPPAPVVAREAPETSSEVPPGPAAEKKSRFGLGKKKDKPAKEPEPAAAPADAEKKRRFGLGKRK